MKISMQNLLAPKPITEFPFGQYQGQKVVDVAATNPEYVIWWSENIEAHTLSDEVIDICFKIALRKETHNIWDGCFDPWDFGSN